jgi:hypothetical protein
MRLVIGLICCLVLGVAALTAGATAYPGDATPAATPFTCPISEPGGKQPPEVANLNKMDGLGNDVLWVSLVMWSEHPGTVEVPNDDHLQPDGRVIEMKWAWYRYVSGRLTITGQRLDAPAPPLEAVIPDGYGATGFQVSGITFPTDGCWQITGQGGDAKPITIVVDVVYPDGFTPVGTPSASPSPEY